MILIQLRLGFVPALIVWCEAHFTDVPWMLPGRLGALRAHFCQAQALRRLEASVVKLIGFLRGARPQRSSWVHAKGAINH